MNNNISHIASTNNKALAEMTDIEIWQQAYHSDKVLSERQREKLITELIKKHDRMLSEIAYNISNYYRHTTSYEDAYQSARLGAMLAYKRYDPEKQDVKKASLVTFVYKTVQCFLLDQMDQESFINCPSQKRAHRLYTNGRYDSNPEKKKKFEERYNIKTEEDSKLLVEKHKLLNSTFVSYDSPIESDAQNNKNNFLAFIEDKNNLSENDIIENIEWQSAIMSMPKLYQSVFNMFFIQRYKASEVSRQLNIDIDQVRKVIKEVKKYFRKNHSYLGETKQNITIV